MTDNEINMDEALKHIEVRKTREKNIPMNKWIKGNENPSIDRYE